MAVLLLMLTVLAWADEVRVAVLPLEKGAGEQAYDGLGKALAGMILTDLAGVPGLALVERERLDAVLEEIELGERGFLDRRTAQKAGKGLGADLLLVGSYSVVDGTLAIDARLVGVGSGEVVRAAASQGPVSDFVGVEKAVVDEVLDGAALDVAAGVRRRIYVQTPTEDFEALVEYGRGLQAEDEGRLEEARAFYEKAAARDPRFGQAVAAMNGIEAALRSRRRVLAEESASKHRALNLAVIEAVPDERTRSSSHRDTAAELADFAVRLVSLENEERDCQRYDEMLHFLRRYDWTLPKLDGVEVRNSFTRHGTGERYEPDEPGPAVAHESPQGRLWDTWRDVPTMVVGNGVYQPWKESSSLTGSLAKCRPGAAQLSALQELRDEVVKHEAARSMPRRGLKLELQHQLTLVWALQTARWEGAPPQLQPELDRLLRLELDFAGRSALHAQIENVLRQAQRTELHRVRRRGLSEERIHTLMRELAAGGGGAVSKDSPYCAYMVDSWQPRAQDWMVQLQQNLKKYSGSDTVEHHYSSAGNYLQPMMDLGCIEGHEARIRGLADAYRFIEGALQDVAEVSPDGVACGVMVAGLRQMVRPEAKQQVLDNPAMAPMTAATLMMSFYAGPITTRCIDPPEVR